MNWVQIKTNWNEVSDKIKLTWGKLSDDDITAIAGQRDQFVRLLQERYGYEQDKAESASTTSRSASTFALRPSIRYPWHLIQVQKSNFPLNQLRAEKKTKDKKLSRN